MAGHSQFKNIMHRKGKQDARRGKVFTKLIREIMTAARTGLPDPAHNPRLKAAVNAAKAENMAKDTIERAIKRASEGGQGEGYEEVRTPLGRFRTLVLVPRMERDPKGLFKRGGQIKVWIAQDGTRLPVKMQLVLKVGTASLLLTRHDAPPAN